jgi:hypothetical protein
MCIQSPSSKLPTHTSCITEPPLLGKTVNFKDKYVSRLELPLRQLVKVSVLNSLEALEYRIFDLNIGPEGMESMRIKSDTFVFEGTVSS